MSEPQITACRFIAEEVNYDPMFWPVHVKIIAATEKYGLHRVKEFAENLKLFCEEGIQAEGMEPDDTKRETAQRIFQKVMRRIDALMGKE